MATESALRTDVSGAVHGVVFVTTAGNGSLDLYSRKLAERLPAGEVDTAVHQSLGGRFGVGLLTRRALRSVHADVASVRRLRRANAELVHLPNHHLGRYGGAALLVEPCDAGALADAVRSALTDEATRKELIDRGLRRAAEFSWERAASETMAVYAAVRERLASRARSDRNPSRV